MANRLGVCSWSLQPKSPADLARKVKEVGLSAVQLALDPLRRGEWPVDLTRETLAAAGIEIRSGMMAMQGEDYSTLETIRRTGGVRPDKHWKANLAAAERNAAIANRLDVKLVSFHAGFIPECDDDPQRGIMLERLRAIVDCFESHGVRVAFETGQETAETLESVLEQLGRGKSGANFDPANIILYGMGDPIDALKRLAPFVRQIHVKDARPTTAPGTWGTEAPVGDGAVDWTALFREVAQARLRCDLMIEREAGETHIADIRLARKLVTRIATQEGVMVS